MEKIVFKKSWVERLDKMPRMERERCVVALYDFLFHGRMTPPCFVCNAVRVFMRSIADEVALDAERRERMRKRREAKKARAEREAKEREKQAQELKEETAQTELTSTEQKVFKTIDYAAHPEMYIIEGFIKYLIATGDTQLSKILPKGMTLDSMEKMLNHCFVTGQRYNSISHFASAVKSRLRHAIREIV